MKGSLAILALIGNISAINLQKIDMVQVSSETNAKLLAQQQIQNYIAEFDEIVNNFSQIDSIQQIKSESEQQLAIERNHNGLKKIVKHVKASHHHCTGTTSNEVIVIDGETIACPREIPDIQDKLTVIARKVPQLGVMEKKLHMMKNLEPELHHLEADLGEITNFDDVKAASIAGKKVLKHFHEEELHHKKEVEHKEAASHKAEEKVTEAIDETKAAKKDEKEVKDDIKQLKEEVKEVAKVEEKAKKVEAKAKEEKAVEADKEKAVEVKEAIKDVGEMAKKVAAEGDLETANKMIEAGTKAALDSAKSDLSSDK